MRGHSKGGRSRYSSTPLLSGSSSYPDGTITLSYKPVTESDEERSGVIIDYDAEGNPVGFEILDASARVEEPHLMNYAIAS